VTFKREPDPKSKDINGPLLEGLFSFIQDENCSLLYVSKTERETREYGVTERDTSSNKRV
jgi:hypothetical protein